jgi:hypothetical protein
MLPASTSYFFRKEREPRTHNIAERRRANDNFERIQFVCWLAGRYGVGRLVGIIRDKYVELLFGRQ